MQHYSDYFEPCLQAVVAVLRRYEIRERFVAECLRGSGAEIYETAVLQLKVNLHKARWGTMISTVRALRSIRVPLYYWNGERMQQKSRADDDED
eukprot:2232950-Amphidinium_carterae.1